MEKENLGVRNVGKGEMDRLGVVAKCGFKNSKGNVGKVSYNKVEGKR